MDVGIFRNQRVIVIVGFRALIQGLQNVPVGPNDEVRPDVKAKAILLVNEGKRAVSRNWSLQNKVRDIVKEKIRFGV